MLNKLQISLINKLQSLALVPTYLLLSGDVNMIFNKTRWILVFEIFQATRKAPIILYMYNKQKVKH